MCVPLDAGRARACALNLAGRVLDGRLRVAESLRDARELNSKRREACGRLGERRLAFLKNGLRALDRGDTADGAFFEGGLLQCDLARTRLDMPLLATRGVERSLRLSRAHACRRNCVARLHSRGLRSLERGARLVTTRGCVCNLSGKRVEFRGDRV